MSPILIPQFLAGLAQGLRRISICLLALWFCAANAFSVEPPHHVEALAPLSSVANWAVAPDSTNSFQLEQWPDTVFLNVARFPEGKTGRLMLKEPIAIPEWADDFVFTANNPGSGFGMGVAFRVLIEDASGQLFLYKATNPKLPHRFQYFPNNFRTIPIRFSLPGLRRPVLLPAAEGNIEALGKRQMPTQGCKIVGLQIESLAFSPRAGEEEKSVGVYFSDFAFTHLSRHNTAFYYAFDGDERFGELDGLPSVTLGKIGPHYGEKFSVSWDIRDDYAGQPFLSGGQEYQFAQDAPNYALLLNQKLEFPIKEKGTYWVHCVRRWTQKSGTGPQRVEDFEYRLDVFKGAPRKKRDQVAADQPVPFSMIRIAPERKSLIYGAETPFVVKTVFWKPNWGTLSWRLEARGGNGGEVVKTSEGTFAPDAGSKIPVDFDLTELKPGGYLVRAQLLWEGKPIDQTERLVGKAGSEKHSSKIPASVPSWQQMLASDQSIVILQPEYNNLPPATRWNQIKACLDQVPSVTSKIEFIVEWRDAEPLPGAYDWSELDRVLAYAHEKGITMMVWPSLVGSEPEWLPSYFEEPRNADGSMFGAAAYNFHGGRLNLWHSDAIRQPALRFLKALATRYKSNPAVHGYYVLTEHPADAPVFNWYVGGSPETQEKFRAYCKTTFGSLPKLNQRWGTQIKAWNEIGVPPEKASDLQRLDWLAFLRDAIGQFYVDAVQTIRKVDSHRLIQTYIDGADSPTFMQLHKLGCILADGGSQTPETTGGSVMGIAEHGLHRRAEEVTCGNWSQMFPTQLDATLYNMALAGGANANIKMFIPATKTFDQLRPAPHSLDRFEKLIPVWNELRKTVPMPRDAYTLLDRNAQLLTENSTSIAGDAWANMILMNAGVMSPCVPLQMATKGKMIFMPRDATYEKAVLDGLVRYVEGGGTLVMSADAGRYAPELSGEDWVLLKRFGFQPPAEKTSNGNYIEVFPVREGGADQTKPFRLRDYWSSSLQGDEQLLAVFRGDMTKPAMTTKPFGKGRVIAVWATTIVPGQDSYPILRDIARSAGVSLHSQGTPFCLWTNLLKNPHTGAYYGLVYHSAYPDRKNGPAVEGVTRWVLPENAYRVTELINGREIGVKTALQLHDEGLPAKLNPYEVAVYRIEPVNATATPLASQPR